MNALPSMTDSWLIFAKSKKLGDSLIAAAAIYNFNHQVPGRKLIVAPVSMREVFVFYGQPAYFYRWEVELLPLGLVLRLLKIFKLFNPVVISVTGYSGNFDFLLKISGPERWVGRQKDFIVENGVPKRHFSHERQLEYCNGVLELACPSFVGASHLVHGGRHSWVGGGGYILVAPNSAECRRSLTKHAFSHLCKKLALNHPEFTLITLLNDTDPGQVVDRGWISNNFPDVRVESPSSLSEIVDLMKGAEKLHTVDTAFYAIGCAIGLPEVTVYFGPTQPSKSVYFDATVRLTSVRDARLGNRHCAVTECTNSTCIESAIGINKSRPEDLNKNCLLRGE